MAISLVLRYDQYKAVFMEQPAHGLEVWMQPLVPLRAPKLFNLRAGPSSVPYKKPVITTAAPISRLRRAGLRKTKPFLKAAFQAMRRCGSSTWIRQD